MLQLVAHTLTGGCACSAVRYRLASPPCDSGACACRQCTTPRRLGESPRALAAVPLTDFRVTHGEAERIRASSVSERWICGACETVLCAYADYQPEIIEVALTTLDGPRRTRPASAPSRRIFACSA